VIAGDLALALDPVRLMERAGLAADPWQADLLRSDARQIAMLCSRQSGKSTATSVLAAHQAAFSPGSLTLIVSPSLRQSGELYLKVRDVLAAIGDLVPPMPQENATTLRLANGSRVVSLPGSEKTVRGFSAPDLVVEDEASRVDDAMHQALRPMLAVSGGRFVLLSTPFGRRGHFHQTWEHGGPDWKRVKITAHDVPRIDPAWLEAERLAIGDWWWQQEYMCVFKDSVDAFFRSEDIDAMASADVVPLFSEVA
jgi:hypothetical protein